MDVPDLVLPVMRARAAVIASLALFTGTAVAHGFEPGVLELREETAEIVRVHWQPPTAGGEVGDGAVDGAIALELPAACRTIAGHGDARFWTLRCVGGLAHGRIAIPALRTLRSDVYVRVVHADGSVDAHLLGPDAPAWSWDRALAARGARIWSGASRFFAAGLRHIATGWDHLLFVLGLLLLARRARPIIVAVTAFTAGHGVALALATFGWIRVPQAPVEAVIALSLAIVGAEVVRDDPTSWMRTRPWLASGGFGVLHGLGFAAALRALDVTSRARPIALAAFNVGVEIGQLTFVVGWLALASAFRRVGVHGSARVRHVAAYAIGTVGAWACIDRVVHG